MVVGHETRNKFKMNDDNCFSAGVWNLWLAGWQFHCRCGGAVLNYFPYLDSIFSFAGKIHIHIYFLGLRKFECSFIVSLSFGASKVQNSDVISLQTMSLLKDCMKRRKN